MLQLRHRRICRKPEPVQLSEPAVAAAAASGLLAAASPDDNSAAAAAGVASLGGPAAGDDAGADAADRPLPSQVVEQLLLERYSAKYERMGLPHKMPGRRKWQSMQQEQRSRSPVQLPAANAMQQAAEAAAAAAGVAATGEAAAAAAIAAAAETDVGQPSSNGTATTLPRLKPAAQT